MILLPWRLRLHVVPLQEVVFADVVLVVVGVLALAILVYLICGHNFLVVHVVFLLLAL